MAYPNTICIVQDLPSSEQSRLHSQDQEVNNKVADPVDRRDAAQKKAPPPGLHESPVSQIADLPCHGTTRRLDPMLGSWRECHDGLKEER